MLVTNNHRSRRLHNPSQPQSSPQELLQLQHQTQPLSQQAPSPTSLPSPPIHSTFSSRAFFNTLPHTSANPSPSEANGKQLQHYFDSSNRGSNLENQPFVLDTSNIPIASIDQYMSNSFDFQQSPANGYPFAAGFTDNPDAQLWSVMGGNMTHGVANSMGTQSRSQQGTSNQRVPSSASSSNTGTRNATSPIQSHSVGSSQPRVTQVPARKPQSLSQGRRRKQSIGRSHLPTPTQTPTQESFLSPTNSNSYQNTHSRGQSQNQNSNINPAVTASMAMNNALQDTRTAAADNASAMSRSGRHSFSSMDQHTGTPMTSIGSTNDQGTKQGHHGEAPNSLAEIEAWLDDYLHADDSGSLSRPMVPKLERTVTDAINDELYYPSSMSAVSAAPQHSNYLIPQVNTFVNERLHAAQMARSNSSHSSHSRGLSPFRPESPWVTNAQLRQNTQMRQQMERPDPQDLSYQTSPHTDSEPKTISPKEAMLDYKPEENEVPLFPRTSEYAPQQSMVVPSPAPQQQYSNVGYGTMAATTGSGWNATLQSLNAPSFQSYQNFMTPNMSIGGLPLNGGYELPQSSRQSDRSPQFPAQLTSMESSASEAAPPSSMASTMTHESPKPVDSSAHTGTYSCTYHGCSERFSTPQKLQKHKRDSHRKPPNVTPGVGSGMSTAELMERNSQTGPHKCERINPTTGKPCNTIFSRPYDLTRHEDTIHNIRKQKVRCALCTEEKTFSRSDALTRHMRVVHPEVDFPGKHRRRGGSSE